MPSWSIHILSLALCLSSGFQQGYIASVLNQPYKEIEGFINDSWTERMGEPMSPHALNIMWSFLNITFPLSTIFGQFLAAVMCRKFGRKNTALVASAMYVPGALMCFASKYARPYFELIYVGRIIWSLANGINSVNATVWIVECAPAAIRGRMAAMQEFFMALGSLMTQAVGVPFSTDELWPMIFVPNVFVSVLSMFMFCYVWESPQYIVEKENDLDKARRALADYHGVDVNDPSVDEELKVCQDAFRKKSIMKEGGEKAKPKNMMNVQHEGVTIIFNPFKANDPTSQVIRHAAWLGVGVKIAYVFTGARCLRSYSTFILHDLSGWDMDPALYLSFLIGLLRLPITLLPVFLVDRLGRRPLILGSIVISALALVLMEVGIGFGAEWKYPTMIALSTLLLINACGLGSVSRFYAAELVPRSLLLSSVSILTMFEAITKIAVEFAWFPLANVIYGESLLLFTLPTLAFIAVIWALCPETSRRSVNDVLNELAIRKNLKVSFTM